MTALMPYMVISLSVPLVSLSIQKSSYKDTSQMGLALTPIAQFYLHHIFKDPGACTVTFCGPGG